VYVIHWNAADWCAEAVTSLGRSSAEIMLTVIDNASDSLPEVAARLMVLPENIGYTGAANVALDDSDSEFIVLCSHDAHVEPDTLELMLDAMHDPSVGLVGPNLMRPDLAYDSGDQIEDREWLDGTCVMLRRTCIEQIGPFDTDYGSYWEDVDYGYRARQKGWRVVRVLSARAYGRGTGGGRRSQTLRRANAVLFAAKHGGSRAVFGSFRGLARQTVWAVLHGRWSQTAECLAAFPLAVRKLRHRRAGSMSPH
jgi:GT2 family glycosyltransferase